MSLAAAPNPDAAAPLAADRLDRHAPSKSARIGGWVMGGLPAAFLLLDGAMKLVRPEPVVRGTVELGHPESVLVGLGLVLIASTVLYLIPRTAVLGATLLTGYLGGAVATHVRAGEPWFFPVIFGVLVWLGLILREPQLRSLVPLRKV